ncbi:MAG: hypothetical protein ACTSVS_00005 [Candidatus Heimdallarchaeota archaeon]
MEENGIRRVVWLPKRLDKIIEKNRVKLGFTRSGFYRYCITKTLQELSILSSASKQADKKGGDASDGR